MPPAAPATLCTPCSGLCELGAVEKSGARSSGAPRAPILPPGTAFPVRSSPRHAPGPLSRLTPQTPGVPRRCTPSCSRARRRPPSPAPCASRSASPAPAPAEPRGRVFCRAGAEEAPGLTGLPGALSSESQPLAGARLPARESGPEAPEPPPLARGRSPPAPRPRDAGVPGAAAAAHSLPAFKRPRTLLLGAPPKRGARGPRSTSPRLPSPFLPAHPGRAALRSDSGRRALRGVPGALSPAPRSGDAPDAGERAQLVRRRASRHHAPAAAAPRRGPRLAAAGECWPAARPARWGRVSAGKPRGGRPGSGAWGCLRRGAGGARGGGSLGLP